MPLRGERLDRLAQLTGGTVLGSPETVVIDVTHDSRQVIVGGMFVAIVGATQDGHGFVATAVQAGAAAVMVERPVEVTVPQLVVADSRRSMAVVAAAVHDDPSRKLSLVGVTGTNGKTTTTFLVEAIARAAGKTTGLMGTVLTRAGNDLIPNVRTTPESSDLQRILGVMVERGVEVVAAEVSSHALALGRVDSTWFEVAAFTNLSPDHLDFHPGMEEYFLAKAELFTADRSRQAVINVGDPWGARLATMTGIDVLTVGGEEGDVRGRLVAPTWRGIEIELTVHDRTCPVSLPILGDFNLDNALVAAGIGSRLGFDLDTIKLGLETAPQVPGRFEVVGRELPITVIVDYAHTPAGVEAVLAAAHAPGRVIVVVGAGGDRDKTKRPLMGAAAVAGADRVVVTSDNPRSEDPDAIIADVLSGIAEKSKVTVEVDRRAAIALAIEMAEPGDVVMILGKGHERGQEIAGRITAFDDRAVAREALERRFGR